MKTVLKRRPLNLIPKEEKAARTKERLKTLSKALRKKSRQR